MQKKITFGLLLLLSIVSTHFPAAAIENPFPPEQLIICNSAMHHSPCTSYSDSQLLETAKTLFGDTINGSLPNPNAPISPFLSGEVQFIVVNISTGQVSRISVQRFGEGVSAFFQAHHLTPLPQDINIAAAAVALENALLDLQPRLTFTQSSGGEFRNAHNQTLAQLLGSGSFPTTNVNRLTPCPTAYAWELSAVFDPSLPGCQAFLTRLIDQWVAEINENTTFWGGISQALANFEASLSLQIVSFNHTRAAIEVTFNLEDGSKMVIRVTEIESGNAIVKVDRDKSRTQSGLTFSAFRNKLNLGESTELSWFETIGMFGHYSCGPQLQATGDIYQRFRVDILEKDPMGRPSRVRIVLIEQIEVVEETLICNFIYE